MANVILSTDSTCDLSKELIEKYQIKIVPLIIILGAKEHIDGKDITPEDIYKYVSETKDLPKTAAPSAEIFKEHFNNLTKNGDSVIHISISNRLSACYQNAKLAAAEFKNVYVIDSYALSTGISLLVLKAYDLLKAGKSIEDTVKEIEVLKHKVNTSFVIDTLDYLHKGGRCGGLALLGANILKIHPMLLMQDGYLKQFKKFRGNMRLVLSNYADHLAEIFQDADVSRIFITHTEMEPELLKMVREIVKTKFKFKEILETTAASTITCHCGKGTLGLLFITKNNIVK